MKPPQEPSTQEVLAGLVERVTFHNSENGFCVLRAKARGHRELVTVIGHAAIISAGEWITASGEWVNDPAHGQQFKARFMRTSAPTSMDGIEKYLGSGMIRGIGPVYAKKLVSAFGEKVFDVIEAEPKRLREVTGIGQVRATRITDAWAEQKIVREIMVFLHSNGVGTARAVRIYKTYGADAVQIMTENPYRLARDIRGIGFKTADAIAMKLGVEKTAMIRVRAGISYALTEAMDDGHCGLPTADLVPLAEALLDVGADLIRTALDLELAEGTVIADSLGETACIFLASLYRAEQAIAERLLALSRATLPWDAIDAEKALPWIEQRIRLELAPSQKAAVRLALASKVLVITGGPGVGKTTIVNAILRILAAKTVKLEVDGYDFEGPTRFDKLFTGIAVETPAWVKAYTGKTGIENIGLEDTFDGDYGRLLDQAAKKHAGGMASPTGHAASGCFGPFQNAQNLNKSSKSGVAVIEGAIPLHVYRPRDPSQRRKVPERKVPRVA